MFKVKSIFFLIIICFCSSISSFSQNNSTGKVSKTEIQQQNISKMMSQEEEGVLKFHHHLLVGLKLTNDGYGAFLEYGVAKTPKKAFLLQLEFTERKSNKEEKIQSPYFDLSPFIFGKINFFYPVKIGIQQQILLGNRANKNGVCVTGNFGGGVSLGLLRPYLLHMVNEKGEFVQNGYESEDSNLFTNDPYYTVYYKDQSQTLIYGGPIGGPDLSDGWNQLKVVPGIYIKPSIRFDYTKFHDVIAAIEIGATAEIYSRKIPQMVFIEQKQYFLGAYFSLLFGSRK